MQEENKHKHGFKLPDNYFEGFEERLFDKLELEELTKDTGFKVPENYFDTVEESILQNTVEQKPGRLIWLTSKRTYLYAASIAACLALVFTFSSEKRTELDQLEISEIESYFDEKSPDLDSYELALFLPETEIEELTLDTDLFSDENLENYLLETIEDTSLLIE